MHLKTTSMTFNPFDPIAIFPSTLLTCLRIQLNLNQPAYK